MNKNITVLVATAGQGVMRTNNGGHSWARAGIDQGMHSDAIVRCLSTDPGAPQTLLAGTDKGLYRTPDAGRTWQASGHPPQRIQRLESHPRPPQPQRHLRRHRQPQPPPPSSSQQTAERRGRNSPCRWLKPAPTSACPDSPASPSTPTTRTPHLGRHRSRRRPS